VRGRHILGSSDAGSYGLPCAEHYAGQLQPERAFREVLVQGDVQHLKEVERLDRRIRPRDRLGLHFYCLPDTHGGSAPEGPRPGIEDAMRTPVRKSPLHEHGCYRKSHAAGLSGHTTPVGRYYALPTQESCRLLSHHAGRWP
jgi:hypothetical protein